MNQVPLIIGGKGVIIYGVLREPKSEANNKMIICVPALTGTRVGPQRMFVEFSFKFAQEGFSTFCFDLAGAGDSYFKDGSECIEKKTFNYYFSFLELVYNYFAKKYKEIILLGISVSCLPCLSFAQKVQLDRVILISPNHLVNNNIVNKKNIKAYFYKLFQFNTWAKFFSLNIKFSVVFRNVILKTRKVKQKVVLKTDNSTNNSKLKVFCVFGEKDFTLSENIKYWNTLRKTNLLLEVDIHIIKSADHSFTGWQFKKDLSKSLIDELTINERRT